jgi:hypothetical protein
MPGLPLSAANIALAFKSAWQSFTQWQREFQNPEYA